MSRPLIASIHIEQATTYRRKVFFYTDATHTTPVNVSGFTFAMSLYKGHYKVNFTITKTNPQQGEIEILLTPTQTEAISTGTYYYDFLARDPANDVSKNIKGTITIYKTGTELPDV
jgi:hypothetical protein